MVFYFISNVEGGSFQLYMGLDKHENEELIRWGWPEDVWFHVDKMSSAHVYLRLKKGQTLDDVPHDVIVDCAQLVKANSISGNKANNVDVVYTMWGNLKKSASMDVGQVSFHKPKEVRMIRLEKRVNEIVNRLNKTKTEKLNVPLRDEREERDRVVRSEQKARDQEAREKQKQEDKEKEKDAEMRSYSSLMRSENMTSNQDAAEDSDDFM